MARSDSGVVPNLATGVAFRLADDSPVTFGLGVFGLVGGGVNYAGSPTQPLLTPRNPPDDLRLRPDLGEHVDRSRSSPRPPTGRPTACRSPSGPSSAARASA